MFLRLRIILIPVVPNAGRNVSKYLASLFDNDGMEVSSFLFFSHVPWIYFLIHRGQCENISSFFFSHRNGCPCLKIWRTASNPISQSVPVLCASTEWCPSPAVTVKASSQTQQTCHQITNACIAIHQPPPYLDLLNPYQPRTHLQWITQSRYLS